MVKSYRSGFYAWVGLDFFLGQDYVKLMAGWSKSQTGQLREWFLPFGSIFNSLLEKSSDLRLFGILKTLKQTKYCKLIKMNSFQRCLAEKDNLLNVNEGKRGSMIAVCGSLSCSSVAECWLVRLVALQWKFPLVSRSAASFMSRSLDKSGALCLNRLYPRGHIWHMAKLCPIWSKLDFVAAMKKKKKMKTETLD